MAVVKADAYGHGAIQVARALAGEGVSFFAVATLTEAIELRGAGISERILVFAPPNPDELRTFEEYELDVSVTSAPVAELVMRSASDGRSHRIHAKVDTGMHRLGLGVDEAAMQINQLLDTANLEVAAVWTHLATASDPEDAFSLEQIQAFETVLQELDARPGCVHVASSAAIFSLPSSLSFDYSVMVRPGIALYGLLENVHDIARFDLKPVMTLRSRVVHIQDLEPGATVSYGRAWTAVRKTRIATVGAGYADGYRRSLSNKGRVAIQDRSVPVVGRVCMDLLMVDVGPQDGGNSDVGVGDEVILFGERGPSAAEVALWIDSLPHEICVSVSNRVPRTYVDSLVEFGGSQDPAGPVFV